MTERNLPALAPVRLAYRNWKGTVSVRSLFPIQLGIMDTQYHGPGRMVLLAWDVEKQATRAFCAEDFRSKPFFLFKMIVELLRKQAVSTIEIDGVLCYEIKVTP
jgi:hypothetical protein